jgi:hypothetical protein
MAAAAAFFVSSAQAQKGRPMEARTSSTQHCIGRFQFGLPETFSVTKRSQSIYNVAVSTHPLAPGGAGAFWKSRIARIERLRPPQGASRALIRSFEFAPGTPAAWYYRNPETRELVALEAAKVVADHAVVANRGADLEMNEVDRLGTSGHAVVERLVKNVLNDYAPSTRRGFCVGSGSIVTAKPARNEQVQITFTHRASPKVSLELETMTVARPDTLTYSNLDEERRTAAPGTRVTVLRETERVVSALRGKEIWVAVAPSGEPAFLRFTWHFPGVAVKGDQPSINIVGSALQGEQALLENAWETLLSSLQPVPL